MSMRWYYNLDGEAVGPVDEMGAKEQIAAGTIEGQTLVWNPEMDSWSPLIHAKPEWLVETPKPASPVEQQSGGEPDADVIVRPAFWQRLLGHR